MRDTLRALMDFARHSPLEEDRDSELRETGKFPDDKKIDRISGALLRIGVILSAILVVAGAILYMADFETAVPHYGIFRGEPSHLTSIGSIFRHALSLQPLSVIQFGLVILIITPVTRVAFAVLAFAVQRDFLYVAVSLFVLGVLVYSLAAGV